MLSAWNQSSEDVLTEEVELSDGPFFCPACQQELLLKQGRKVVAHFAKSIHMLSCTAVRIVKAHLGRNNGMAATVDDIRSRVHACLHALAKGNNDATNSSHAGFNRLDAAFGCELAEKEYLSLAEVVVGTGLLRRYRRQLEALGMAVPDEAKTLSWAIEQGEGISTEEIALTGESANALDKASKRVYVRDGRLCIEFPYDRAKIAAMQPLKKAVEGWDFNRYQRQEWSFPRNAASTVFKAIRGFQGFVYSVEATQLITRTYRKETLLHQAHELEERWHQLSQLAALEAAHPYLAGAPVANGQRLFRHQREAVQRMIEAQRFILAHQMGLGKSRSALIAAQAYDLPIWVIAPAGTIINWQREAAAAGVEIMLFSWAKLPEPPDDTDYVLIADECFPYHTQVLTDRGPLPIGRIVEQALPVSVLSYDLENKKREWKPIVKYSKKLSKNPV
jgi:Competence protein CoiA-like family